VGLDASGGGWLAVVLEGGQFAEARRARGAATLISAFPDVEAVGVDIPIGLPETPLRGCRSGRARICRPAMAERVPDVSASRPRGGELRGRKANLRRTGVEETEYSELGHETSHPSRSSRSPSRTSESLKSIPRSRSASFSGNRCRRSGMQRVWPNENQRQLVDDAQCCSRRLCRCTFGRDRPADAERRRICIREGEGRGGRCKGGRSVRARDCGRLSGPDRSAHRPLPTREGRCLLAAVARGVVGARAAK
jgi:hypothetical protein